MTRACVLGWELGGRSAGEVALMSREWQLRCGRYIVWLWTRARKTEQLVGMKDGVLGDLPCVMPLLEEGDDGRIPMHEIAASYGAHFAIAEKTDAWNWTKTGPDGLSVVVCVAE